MRIFNKEHENQLITLLQMDETHPKDVEKVALFYILSGSTDLYAKSNSIYDFAKHQIEPDCLHDGSVDFCSSSRALIRLAYNLYNGYQDERSSPIHLLSGLDTDNFLLATESMGIRFGHSEQVQFTLNDEELEL